jgi:hypothetical protein
MLSDKCFIYLLDNDNFFSFFFIVLLFRLENDFFLRQFFLFFFVILLYLMTLYFITNANFIFFL